MEGGFGISSYDSLLFVVSGFLFCDSCVDFFDRDDCEDFDIVVIFTWVLLNI